MNLSALAGNQRIKDQLSQQERERGLSHAYILSGPAGSGRHVLARQLAAAMLCTGTGECPCGRCVPCQKAAKGIHPDLSVIAGPEEGKPITVDQVRALRADAYIRPNEGERKIYLLEHADRMNPSAQNAMLKLLEEGPAYAAFLLLAENGGGLLQTVRSRCEELALTPAGEPEGDEGDQARQASCWRRPWFWTGNGAGRSWPPCWTRWRTSWPPVRRRGETGGACCGRRSW